MSLRTQRALLLAAAALIAMAALFAVASLTTIGQQIDASAVDHHPYDRTLPGDVDAYSVLMDGMAMVLVPIVLWMGRRRPVLLMGLGAGAAAAFGIATALKPVLPRPDLLPGIQFGNSFPSGHAAVSAVLAFGLVVLAPTRRSAALAATAAALLGTFAVFEPIHRPSDVLGGFLLGAATVALVFAWTSWAARPDPPVRQVRWGRAGLVAVLQLAALLTLAALGAARAGLALGDFGPGFIAAAALILITADLAVVVFRTIAAGAAGAPP